MRLHNPFTEVKAQEIACFIISGVPRTWKRHVDNTGEVDNAEHG